MVDAWRLFPSVRAALRNSILPGDGHLCRYIDQIGLAMVKTNQVALSKRKACTGGTMAFHKLSERTSKTAGRTTLKPAYQTDLGRMFNANIETAMSSEPIASLKGQVNLVFTSPPFPLVKKKKYGNLDGEEYLAWITRIATQLTELLAPDGSLVVEIGNAWERGRPVMSTLPIETLLAVSKVPGLHLCQQFICHNPARIPGPAQWVTIERIRVKDSFTQVWWFSKTDKPKADNRAVLAPYTDSMKSLLRRRKYNAGARPSGHRVSKDSFFTDNGGAIPPSVLEYSNTAWSADYRTWCADNGVPPHPASMSPGLAEFFVKFLTDENDIVLDPFGGSNTTGSVAESLGRRWISVELDPNYVFGSRGRFDALRSPLRQRRR